jgi:hypothetical protein
MNTAFVILAALVVIYFSIRLGLKLLLQPPRYTEKP